MSTDNRYGYKRGDKVNDSGITYVEFVPNIRKYGQNSKHGKYRMHCPFCDKDFVDGIWIYKSGGRKSCGCLQGKDGNVRNYNIRKENELKNFMRKEAYRKTMPTINVLTYQADFNINSDEDVVKACGYSRKLADKIRLYYRNKYFGAKSFFKEIHSGNIYYLIASIDKISYDFNIHSHQLKMFLTIAYLLSKLGKRRHRYVSSVDVLAACRIMITNLSHRSARNMIKSLEKREVVTTKIFKNGTLGVKLTPSGIYMFKKFTSNMSKMRSEDDFVLSFPQLHKPQKKKTDTRKFKYRKASIIRKKKLTDFDKFVVKPKNKLKL